MRLHRLTAVDATPFFVERPLFSGVYDGIYELMRWPQASMIENADRVADELMRRSLASFKTERR